MLDLFAGPALQQGLHVGGRAHGDPGGVHAAQQDGELQGGPASPTGEESLAMLKRARKYRRASFILRTQYDAR